MSKAKEEFDLWVSAMARIGVSKETHYHPLLQIADRMGNDIDKLEDINKDLYKALTEARKFVVDGGSQEEEEETTAIIDSALKKANGE